MIDQIARILRRRSAYRRVFWTGTSPNQDQEAVLADLHKFCRADEPTVRVSNGNIDTNAMLLAEGRREVWLRINAHLKLSDADLAKLKERQTNE